MSGQHYNNSASVKRHYGKKNEKWRDETLDLISEWRFSRLDRETREAEPPALLVCKKARGGLMRKESCADIRRAGQRYAFMIAACQGCPHLEGP